MVVEITVSWGRYDWEAVGNAFWEGKNGGLVPGSQLPGRSTL
jgi:hypothetical protein